MKLPSILVSLLGVFLSLIFLFGFPGAILSSSATKIFRPIDENPIYVLVLGLDKEIEGTRRTDVIMIVGFDLKRNEVVISSVPRDLIVGNVKINSIYAKKGLDTLEETLEKLVGIRISKYVIFDYSAFKLLGDELGPVEIEVEKPMIYYDYAQNLKIEFKPGVYEMYGDQLLAYIRYRKGGMGDIDRISKERYVLEKFAQRVKEVPMEKLVDVAEKLLERIETNFEMGEISYILLKLKSGFEITSVKFPYRITAEGNVVLDVGELDLYRKRLGLFEGEKSRKFRFIVLNNHRESPLFFDNTLRIWRERVGYEPVQIFWEKVDTGLEGSFVLARHESVMKEIEKVYPNRKFELLNLSKLENLEKYYRILDELSKTRLYPKLPVDAIVLVGGLK